MVINIEFYISVYYQKWSIVFKINKDDKKSLCCLYGLL